MAPATTLRQRVLDAAVVSIGARGLTATSFGDLAAPLGVTKQAVLYHFPSKGVLLDGVIDAAAAAWVAELERATGGGRRGLDRVDAVVRAAFGVAARRPELLGVLREAARLGPPASTRLAAVLAPLTDRAVAELEREMDAGLLRQRDARFLVLTAAAAVLGTGTDREIMRAVGVAPTVRSLVRARRELSDFLRAGLAPAVT